MLRLNCVSNNLFDTGAIKRNNSGMSEAIKVGNTSITRADIVTTGRLVVCEYIGSYLNSKKNGVEKYKSRLNGEVDYATLSQRHKDAKFAFCTYMAYKEIGKPLPETVKEMKNDMSLATNRTFLATMAAIDTSVIQPLFFDVIDDISMDGLMNLSPVAFGETKQIDIKSNDVFMFQDASHGSQWASPYNYMYGQTITLTPTPRTCNVKIKWYQDVVNGEAGEYYAAIIRGMYADIYARFNSTLTAAAGNSKYLPAGLQATTYTTQNFLRISQKVAAANGVDRSALVAFGSAVALNSVVPQDENGAMLGLQYGLGEQWFTNGFIPRVGKVALAEVRPTFVPGTQNRDMVEVFPDNVIYIAMRGAGDYAPIQAVYAEGSPMTITLTPRETGDLTIDMAVMAMLDFAPVFASKIGKITLS